MKRIPFYSNASRRGRILFLLGVALLPILCCASLTILFPADSTAVPTSERVAEIIVEATAEPSPIPTEPPPPTELPPTATPVPTVVPTAIPTAVPSPDGGWMFREMTPQEIGLRAELDAALGESNRGLGRRLDLFQPGFTEHSIVIGWSADGAETNALIREGMERDTLTVLQIVIRSGIEYDSVDVAARYLGTIEQFNITDELEMLSLTYYRDTLEGIDWSSVTPGEIFGLADSFTIDPMFE